MKDVWKPLLVAVAAFVAAKFAIAAIPVNETTRLLLVTVAAAVIAGIFTRRLRARGR